MTCNDCDYFFGDFCNLYERFTDSFDSCAEFASMEANLWDWDETEVEQEDDGFPD